VLDLQGRRPVLHPHRGELAAKSANGKLREHALELAGRGAASIWVRVVPVNGWPCAIIARDR
jgi:hypothetical protein